MVQDSGSAVGTAATVNFADNLSVTFAAGISTITGIGTGNIITDKLNVTGISTLQNDVLIGSGVTLSPDGDGFFTGVVTATSYAGDGSSLTGIAVTDNVRTGILDVAGIATFRNNLLVGSGVTLSVDGDGFYTGVITATKYEGDGSALTGFGTASVRTDILEVAGISTFNNQIVGISTNNLVPFLFNNYSDLPLSLIHI